MKLVRPVSQTLALLALLVLSPALEGHEPRGHLSESLGTFPAGAVYLAGHESADDSLHIEPLGGIESAHCVGCLLRQNRSGVAVGRQLLARLSIAAPVANRAADPLPLDPSRFSGSPRAPPKR